MVTLTKKNSILNAFQWHGSAEKPLEIDHHLYEFGSVEYHIQVKLLPCIEAYTMWPHTFGCTAESRNSNFLYFKQNVSTKPVMFQVNL